MYSNFGAKKVVAVRHHEGSVAQGKSFKTKLRAPAHNVASLGESEMVPEEQHAILHYHLLVPQKNDSQWHSVAGAVYLPC